MVFFLAARAGAGGNETGAVGCGGDPDPCADRELFIDSGSVR